jgi:hypothetical protein
MIELVWDDESGEGQVKITKEFLTAHRIVQLDALVDWMAELQEIYDAMVVIP